MTDQLFAQPGSSLVGLDSRLTIVFVADGFQAADVNQFRIAVSRLDLALRATAPLDSYRDTINVLRVETESVQSGTDIDSVCPSPPSNTRFRATFCTAGDLERSLSGDGVAVLTLLESFPPLRDRQYYPVVLFNSNLHGGLKTPVMFTRANGAQAVKLLAWATLKDGGVDIVLHEIGHSIFELADEYEQDGAERTNRLPASVPENYCHNLTRASSRAALQSSANAVHRAWGAMIKPTTPLPSTKPKPTDTPLDEDPVVDGVDPADVGLFEGGEYRTKGIFRPRATCRMRSLLGEWCPVCQFAIRARLGEWQLPQFVPSGTAVIGPATHLAMLSGLDRSFVVGYDAATGEYTTRNAGQFIFNGDHDSWSPPGETLGAGWTAMAGFGVGNFIRGVLTHDAITGRRALFRLVDGGKGKVRLVQVFVDGPAFGESWTSVSVFDIGGLPHLLGYNSFTGAATLARLDVLSATPGISEIQAWRTTGKVWQTGWSHVLGHSLRGIPLVLRFSTSGPRDVHALLPLGNRPRDWAPGDPTQAPGFTHVLPYADPTLNGVLRYSATSGTTLIEQARSSLVSFDEVGRRQLTPGGLTVLGVGSGVFAYGTVPFDQPLPVPPPERTLFFHHAPVGELQTFTFSRIVSP